MKSLSERLAEEVLSDNTQFTNCEQCENCIYWNNGDVWSNKFIKASCQMFPHPRMKPLGVINNTEACSYRKESNGNS